MSIYEEWMGSCAVRKWNRLTRKNVGDGEWDAFEESWIP
jgi:hypothetical protein